MKKNLRHLWLLLVGVLITFSAQQARASHAIGGDMSYTNVGPGLFFVTYRFYRDCSGIEAPAEFELYYKAYGCGASGTDSIPVANRVLPRRGFTIGNPYCTRQNNLSQCDSTGVIDPPAGFPNYSVYTYGAIVVLGTGPTSECTDWVMSTNVNARPDTRNLEGGSTLYTEVHLNTKLAPEDNSPAFPSTPGFQPLIFVCDSTTRIELSQVVDPDNTLFGTGTDSLVYSSARPLQIDFTIGRETWPYPTVYTNGHSLANPVRILPGTILPSGDSIYPFTINPVTGTIRFTAGNYIPGSPQDQDNKFAISLLVETYRKVNENGQMVRRKISSVQRDILVVVFNCLNPTVPPIVDNTGTLPPVTNIGIDTIVHVLPTDTLTVDACSNATINVQLLDANGDSIFAFISAGQLPGQASVQIFYNFISPPSQGFAGLTSAYAQLLWVPDASTVGNYYSFTLRVQDNGCPIPSRTDQPLVLHVVKNQYSDVGLSGTGTTDTLCLGDSTVLIGTTRRPATFGFPPQAAQYDYQWEQDANNTVRSNGSRAVVRPTETTRYKVNVISPQGCIDTASVRIVVAPRADTLPEIPVVQYLPGTSLQYGAFYQPDPRVDGMNVPNLVASNDPTGTTFRYRIRGVEGLEFFNDTTSTTPVVNGLIRSADFRLVQISSNNCTTVRRFRIEVPLVIYNVITPDGDKKNDFFTVSGVLNPEVQIYNRWGKKIEEWSAYKNNWNAADQGPGTYFYYVRDKEQNKTYKGWVEVVK